MALVTILNQGLDEESATGIQHKLGDYYYDENGWKWVYSKAGAAISINQVVVPNTNIAEDTVSTNTAVVKYNGKTYAVSQVIENGGSDTTWTAGAYAGYIGIVDEGTGVGQTFEIEANDTTRLFLKAALTTALVIADSDIEFFNSNVVIKSPTTLVNPPNGVASKVGVTSGYYFWRQTTGMAPILIGSDVSAADADSIVVPDDTAGSAALGDPSQTLIKIGTLTSCHITPNTTDKIGWVRLTLE